MVEPLDSTPSLDGSILRLEIATTWCGEPIPADEQTVVELRPLPSALEIVVDAPWHGDPPPPGPPRSLDGLWEYEVVEVFVAGPPPEQTGKPVVYTEIELSPHGHHWVLQLRGIRQPHTVGIALDFVAQRTGARWQGRARLERRWLPEGPHRVNAFAIHGVGDARRYLAATPTGGDQPDFHRPEMFAPTTLWS